MNTNIKYTRADYMANKCSFNEYYSQFVNPQRVAQVGRLIGVDKIKLSKCPHFNDIPLKEWDKLPQMVTRSELERVNDTFSLSTNVCIAKVCAGVIRGE